MRHLLIAVVAGCVAAPSLAQGADDQPLPSAEDVRDADGFTIGVGAGFTPDYEGSDDYRLIPGAAIRGKTNGVSFATRGRYLYVDLISGGSGNMDFDAGPIAGVRLNRTRKLKDDVVNRLPDRKVAIEIGGFAGISWHGLTNPYDTLGLQLDVVKDVGSAHQSTIFSPSIDFSTPLSKTLFVGASLSADFVSGRYADYYFSISPSDTLASGLPTFNAGGGMKNWKIGLLANQSLSGDLRRGWSLFGLASFSHLQGDFKRSPIVSLRGSAGQWFGGAGVAYSF